MNFDIAVIVEIDQKSDLETTNTNRGDEIGLSSWVLSIDMNIDMV